MNDDTVLEAVVEKSCSCVAAMAFEDEETPLSRAVGFIHRTAVECLFKPR
jgi:hypothetical protein